LTNQLVLVKITAIQRQENARKCNGVGVFAGLVKTNSASISQTIPRDRDNSARHQVLFRSWPWGI